MDDPRAVSTSRLSGHAPSRLAAARLFLTNISLTASHEEQHDVIPATETLRRTSAPTPRAPTFQILGTRPHTLYEIYSPRGDLVETELRGSTIDVLVEEEASVPEDNRPNLESVAERDRKRTKSKLAKDFLNNISLDVREDDAQYHREYYSRMSLALCTSTNTHAARETTLSGSVTTVPVLAPIPLHPTVEASLVPDPSEIITVDHPMSTTDTDLVAVHKGGPKLVFYYNLFNWADVIFIYCSGSWLFS